MSAANGSVVPGETVTNTKGKGKAVEQSQSHDMSMDEDEDTSEGEESVNEEPVSQIPPDPISSLLSAHFYIVLALLSNFPRFQSLPAVR